jgi:branched-subunit amino acid transport protein
VTPVWLHILSIIGLAGGVACALYIAADEMRRPQRMWVMYIVWPTAVLFAGPLAVWLYRRKTRAARQGKGISASAVLETAFHCGAGCTLGDIASEWLAFVAPGILGYFGWPGVFHEKVFAVWILDFALAFVLGIAFQYFTIKPMRKLGSGEALIEALKADTLSLIAWQIGMYGAMAFARFYVFGTILGAPLVTDTVEFWFVMQGAMLTGLATAYPVNFWLLKTGIKEPM